MTKVLIVGAGQMGSGIAQVAAQAGNAVLLNDRDRSLVDRGLGTIRANLDRAVDKQKISPEERDQILARIEPYPALARIDVDIVIEAATENPEIKFELFRKLDALTPERTILASNTSSISITKIGAVTKRPQNVIGMHYFNPVPLMKLVEVIRGIATSQATYEFVRKLAIDHGKTPVEVRNFPGFVSNRLLCPMLNEAVFALYEGIGTVESIDTVMKLGMNHPMGPLTLADFVGLDTLLAVMNVLYEGYNDPKYRPCPLLKEYVDAGWLGRKSGRGFYDYSGSTPVPNGVAGVACE
ncbi:MAG TPA: 3-hydroxybutyryl-CoA dehydrogenase [Candidatus Baltobacteraceae bacterium]|jgi:3-hydroxybutyryl-CoA dehydrogenase|nr:3-hydroxybutyryl-CoA dehydrogenase [Candidatus Baltobacteraceae bacterium]